MAFARLRWSWTTQVTRVSQLHTGNGLSTRRSLCAWSRSSSNAHLPHRGHGRRAVSPAVINNLNAAGYHHKGYSKNPVLSTLDPDRLLPDDLLDFSGMIHPSILLESRQGPHSTARVLIRYKVYGSRVSSTPEAKESAQPATLYEWHPFPDNTRGFLYFRRSPHPHPDAGEIRFRLVRPEDDGLSPAERFRRGSDLVNHEGLAPWRIHTLNTIRQFPVLRKKLVEEGLVPQVAGKGNCSRRRFISGVLESITDPFILHFGSSRPYLTILREEGNFTGEIFFGCSLQYRALGGKGMAWVRFEMANLPWARDPSRTVPRLVVRVLKYIEAPTQDIAIPGGQIFKEGELIQVYSTKSKSTTGTWAVTPLYEERILTPSTRKLLQDMYLNRSSSYLPTISDLCPRSRSSSDTQLPRRAVSPAITKNLNAAGYHHKGYSKNRVLSTLDPDRLLPDDLLDFSGMINPSFLLESRQGPHSTARVSIRYKSYSSLVSSTPGAKESAQPATRYETHPFPDNTRGFLYFRRSPHPHPDAGEIRFRLVRPEDDGLSPAERFRRGSDLVNHEGLAPWRIHTLNTIRQFPVLRKKLVEEGLVPQVAGKGNCSWRRFTSGVLESITDPFILHFGSSMQQLTILREEGNFTGGIFFGCSLQYCALGGKGMAWVRFEMANLPWARDPSRTVPRLVVRVLKYIEAPTQDIAIPGGQIFKEGELIQVYSTKTKSITGTWALTPVYEERILSPSTRKLLEDTYLGNSVTTCFISFDFYLDDVVIRHWHV